MGEGAYAELMARRFEVAGTRLGYDDPRLRLRTDLFARPGTGAQLALF